MIIDENRGFDGGFKEMCAEAGYDIADDLSEHVCFYTYESPDLTYGDTLGSTIDEAQTQFVFIAPHVNEKIVKLSDYNALMQLYGRKPLEMNADECIVLANFLITMSRGG